MADALPNTVRDTIIACGVNKVVLFGGNNLNLNEIKAEKITIKVSLLINRLCC